MLAFIVSLAVVMLGMPSLIRLAVKRISSMTRLKTERFT